MRKFDSCRWHPSPSSAVGFGGTRRYVNPDGTIDVYTRHASFFGVLADIAGPSAPAAFRGSYGKGRLTFTWQPASDNSGRIARYELRLAEATLTTATVNAASVSARAGSFSVRAIDASGNVGAASSALSVTKKPRPKGIPKQIPAWYAKWRAWRLAPYTIR